MNDATFERRTYEGSEGQKGELFGLKNIFRYRPEGFVTQNVRVMRAPLLTSTA